MARSPRGESAQSGASDGRHTEPHDATSVQPAEAMQNSDSLFTRPVAVASGTELRRLAFYVGLGGYDRASVARAVRAHGGEVREDPSTAANSNVIHLTDVHAKLSADALTPAYKWTFVTDCVAKGELLDIGAYKIPRRKPVGRPRGNARNNPRRAHTASAGGPATPDDRAVQRGVSNEATVSGIEPPAIASAAPFVGKHTGVKTPPQRPLKRLRERSNRALAKRRRVITSSGAAARGLEDESDEEGGGKAVLVQNEVGDKDTTRIPIEVKEEPMAVNVDPQHPDGSVSGARTSDGDRNDSCISGGKGSHGKGDATKVRGTNAKVPMRQEHVSSRTRQRTAKMREEHQDEINSAWEDEDSNSATPRRTVAAVEKEVGMEMRTAGALEKDDSVASWTSAEDRRVMFLGREIEVWLKSKGSMKRSTAWIRMVAPKYLPPGRHWRECMRRYMNVCSRMCLTANQRVQPVPDSEPESEQGSDVDIEEQYCGQPQIRSNSIRGRDDRERSKIGSPSKTRTTRGVNRIGRREKRDEPKELAAESDVSSGERALNKRGKKTQSEKQLGSGKKRVRESNEAKQAGREERGDQEAGWRKLFSLVPDIPPDRVRAVVYAVRDISNRAGISQQEAFEAILECKGNFEELTEEIEKEQER